ncbi:kinesin-like protein kif19 [Limosa lapponica baueri]|uniref:Kinesin-like protein kif19 n=1 Tax=Limosa lapponica baueri TaxID=1758121 RepID=A0A2I0TCP1_LIMLA|nr:kinesin-like protein kif19 [Limosa lapponica baueri]
MEMRRSLMELENTNIELHVDTCRHLLTIADWEREKAQGARKDDKPAKEEKGENTEEEDGDVDTVESPEPHEVTVAREEINLLLVEQRRTAALKPHNSPSLDVSQHLDPNKDEVRKGPPGNMKDLPWGVKFDIPSITLESDRLLVRSTMLDPKPRSASRR